MPSKQSVSAHSAKAQKAAALLKKEKKEPAELSPKTRAAIELMVFEGNKRSEAAATVGMHDESLRRALTKPNTLAYLNECMEVLRTGARPRALHKIIALSEKASSERVSLDAAKYLDGMDRGAHQVGATQVNVQVNNSVNVLPGYVIDLTGDSGASAQQIEHLGPHGDNGLDDLADVPPDE
ncbi:hypothetical protein MRS76_11285 [Rhizobiaceae bacterium n13]|nr:hypothetical protein [Fererhizobium litorale]